MDKQFAFQYVGFFMILTMSLVWYPCAVLRILSAKTLNLHTNTMVYYSNEILQFNS